MKPARHERPVTQYVPSRLRRNPRTWAVAGAAVATLLSVELATKLAGAEPALEVAPEAGHSQGNATDRTRAGGRAVYYQPRVANIAGPNLEVPAGVYTMVAEPGNKDSWTIGNCRTGNAANFASHIKADRLIGWSLGRMGPPYALETMDEATRKAVEHILVIDPGNEEDFTDSCDPPATSQLYDEWLGEDSANRLVIIAGERTAQNNYEGIRNHMLGTIAARGDHGSQVVVCGYETLGHQEAFAASKDQMVAPPIASPADCPAALGGSMPVNAWQP